MLEDNGGDGHEPVRDFGKMFDLDRTTLTKNMVERMERALREADAAREEMKGVVADCKEREFAPRDIQAMKKIAKLRVDDKKSAAQEQLEALERVGKAVGFDLFDWAGAK